MPLGDEYDLSTVEEETFEEVRDTYDEAVDASWMQEIEDEAAFLLEQYDRWPTIPRYAANPRNQYRNARNILRTSETRYTAEALEVFVSAADFEQRPTAVKPGLFVSAAVAELEPEETDITLPDLSRVDYAFYRNEADVTVEGSVGDKAAQEMRSGTLTIKGDAGTHCGRFMDDGSITVAGDAGRALGHGMRSGAIHIHGDADDLPGLQKKGGRITVEGETGRLPHTDSD